MLDMKNDKSTRRTVLATTSLGVAGMAFPSEGNPASAANSAFVPTSATPLPGIMVVLKVNGTEHRLTLDPRVTLLDAMREHLHLTGSKKGCDHGQCGACTMIVEGRRLISCLTLAVMHDGEAITTIEGLGEPGRLHPMQAEFLRHDGFQCGYCTPGQICSAVAMLNEIEQGIPSHVTEDMEHVAFSDTEVRERMSGNLCRCAAYPNIIAAIRAVHEGAKA